jgi:hypothetical protein
MAIEWLVYGEEVYRIGGNLEVEPRFLVKKWHVK